MSFVLLFVKSFSHFYNTSQTCALLMIYVYGEGQQPNVESLEITLKPIVSSEVYVTVQKMLSIHPLERPQINEVNIRPTLSEIDDSMRAP